MKRKTKREEPHWSDNLTKKDLIEHCEWTRASCDANLAQMFRWLLRLEDRLRKLEQGET